MQSTHLCLSLTAETLALGVGVALQWQGSRGSSCWFSPLLDALFVSEEVVEEGAWGRKAEGRYFLLIRTLWLGREISRSVVMAVTCLRT